jgi:hypothetical protein
MVNQRTRGGLAPRQNWSGPFRSSSANGADSDNPNGADDDRANPMDDQAGFKDHLEMQEYAERNGLDYTWERTPLFEKRRRMLPPDRLEVRPVRTKRGITMVGLFSKEITRAEREADAPYREAMAAKRLARISRAERRMRARRSVSRGRWPGNRED